MSTTEQAPVGVDPNIPSTARIYDYLLGGKDNFASDRAAAEAVLNMLPESRQMAKDNRAFLGRAVRHLAESGITQYLDIGAGLPTQENVHQVALAANPDARIVYVDNDPIVLVHARALLAGNPNTTVLKGDLHSPDEIIDAAAEHLDFTKPVAVLLVAVLHFFPDDEETYAIVDSIRARLAPGSAVVVSHVHVGDYSTQVVDEGKAVYATTATGSLVGRTTPQVRRYLEGTTVLEPGVVPVEAWHPEHGEVEIDLTKAGVLGGVGIVSEPALP